MLFRERQKGDRSGSFDCDRRFALMTQTVTRDPSWDNASSFRQKISQQSDVLVIDRDLFMTEPAYTPTLK